MKLSICIPIHNFDVNALVSDIKKEIETNTLDAEILLIDDASQAVFLEVNSQAAQSVDFYKSLKQNIGRSAVRNMFLDYACGDYLMFLDCDGKIISESFIRDYLKSIEDTQPDVIYGGRTVSHAEPDRPTRLRWDYATKRENLSLAKRRERPYLGFQTNNFVVRKEIFRKFPFDEKLKDYGYEDLLFAMELKAGRIGIAHIDNPVFNNNIETNAVFAGKAGDAARNLACVLKDPKTKDKVAELRLSRAYRMLRKYRLGFLFDKSFYVFEPLLKAMLNSGKAPLRILDFYKLGILSREMSKS